MSRDFKFKKRTILTGLALLIAGDVALAAYSWHLSKSPGTSTQEMDLERRKLKAMRADVEYAEKNVADFPKTLKDCDRFESDLPQAVTVSSTISGELSDIARKAGVQLADIRYGDKQIEGRNITQREMDADITGDYSNFIKFLNGLQKSPNYYVVDSLDLGPESNAPNLVRVKIHMRTFYRSGTA